jgi:hypothetical protein
MKMNRSLLSTIAIVFALIASFAFKTSSNFDTQWGVLTTDADYYYVEALVGEQGTDYLCTFQQNRVCTLKVVTTAPDNQNRIPKSASDITILVTNAKYQ